MILAYYNSITKISEYIFWIKKKSLDLLRNSKIIYDNNDVIYRRLGIVLEYDFRNFLKRLCETENFYREREEDHSLVMEHT